MASAADLDLVDYMEWAAGVYARLNAGIRRRLDRAHYTVTERRILRVIFRRPDCTDAEVATELGMTSAQLSRAMTGLIAKGLIEHQPSSKHKKQRLLRLTQDGETATATLDEESKDAFAAQLEEMRPREQKIIMDALEMGGVRRRSAPQGVALELRTPTVEDLGWLFSLLISYGHRTYEWNTAYTAFMAEQFRSYALRADDVVETGWIAYRHGRRAGGCLMVYGDDPLRSGEPDALHATLSAIIVSPRFRNIGIGSRLLERCIKQAQDMTLMSLLATASKRQTDLHNLYRKFKLVPRRQTEMDFRYGTRDEWRDYVLSFGLRRPGRPPRLSS